MIEPGLVSVTFRKLHPSEIVALAARTGLSVIEWGGDIHVPHGQVGRAREVRRMTLEAGLRVASYGSYYTLGSRKGPAFEAVVDTALALGAPVIRVWAGERGSAEADDAYRHLVADDSHRTAELAGAAGLVTAFEFHHGTLTDTAASARELLERVNHPAARTYWQPATELDGSSNEAGLGLILSWLVNVHVYQIHANGQERLPLSDGAEPWSHYLSMLAVNGRPHYAMLEFVRDDSPDAFVEDAADLRRWVAAANTSRMAPEDL
ncbi:MAG TPA: TIM barrel protein [Spirochaetia bacterium]|nr:TIM barrel protein [Spirochaetia bacterium]